MVTYNRESFQSRESYTAQIHLPGRLFEELVWWALQALPDEILVGMDIDAAAPHLPEVETMFKSSEHTEGLFQGQGFIIGEAHIVNRGNSYSVHHLPEDWTDDICFQLHAVHELVVSPIGFTHTRMLLRFQAMLMLMLLKKHRVLT